MLKHYKLEKYKGRNNNRYPCPECGQPHVFTRYICIEDGKYIADYVGRCDREAKCGYHYTPQMYFRDNPWDGEERVTRNRLPPPPPKPKPVYLPIAYAEQRVSTDSPFVEWLYHLFGQRARTAVEDYYLGATKRGLYKSNAVIFWQIDECYQVHDGKMMWYKTNGHREKFMTWVSAKLKKVGRYPDQDTEKCLFGQHLLRLNRDQPIGLVESEKSAVVCSCLFPELLWVATCGCGGLNRDKVSPLGGRRVLVFPDSGSYDKWSEILLMSGLDYKMVSLDNYPPNTDLVDILIDKVRPETGEQTDVAGIIKQFKT